MRDRNIPIFQEFKERYKIKHSSELIWKKVFILNYKDNPLKANHSYIKHIIEWDVVWVWYIWEVFVSHDWWFTQQYDVNEVYLSLDDIKSVLPKVKEYHEEQINKVIEYYKEKDKYIEEWLLAID